MRSLLALTLGTLLAGGLVLAVTTLRSRDPVPPPPPLDASTSTDTRLFYPTGSSPRLSLPGGKTETVHSVLNIPGPLHYGAAVWDDARVPQGPVWVRVDLKRQLLSVFRAGHEIGTAVILYGAGDKPSPTGTFPVLQKAADYHSRSYDAEMPYMLRLTADGVAIHGSNVRRGAATHGCIGVPIDFARRLFGAVQLGDPVVILGPQADS
jgi:hypothetical protein